MVYTAGSTGPALKKRDRKNGGCTSGQRRGRDLGQDSKVREPEGQEDFSGGRQAWLRLTPGRREPGRVHRTAHCGGEKQRKADPFSTCVHHMHC